MKKVKIVHVWRHDTTHQLRSGPRHRSMFYVCLDIAGQRFRLHIGREVVRNLLALGVKEIAEEDHACQRASAVY